MDVFWTIFAVLFLAGLVVVWFREQKIWKRFYGEPGRNPGNATVLYNELLRAGIRTRYKLTGTGASMSRGHSSLVQTPLVLVHRDDLHKAEEIRSAMRRQGRL